MLKRITSALIMLPLLIVLYFGGMPLYICTFIITAIGLKEFFGVFNEKNINPDILIGYIFALFLLMKNIFGWNLKIELFSIFVVFFITGCRMLFRGRNIIEFSITMLGIIYVCIFFDCIPILYDNVIGGNLYVWLIFLISFGTDSMAYFAGMAFGKHKLVPKISPKKTVEGAIGGLAGSIVFSLVFAIFALDINLGYIVIIAAFGSVISQIGDLFASSVKRYCNVKDYGDLIPGHGGILDRFDSVLMTSPLVLFLSYILVNI